MFANALVFRKGAKFGMPKNKIVKRSSMQDLLEGKCPGVNAETARIQDQSKSQGTTIAGGRVALGLVGALGLGLGLVLI